MKDTVTRILFCGWGLGGRVSGSRGPFCFLWIFGVGGLAKNSVIFLCTGFCINHVQDGSLKKKKRGKKENVCICLMARTLCDSISTASIQGLIFV